MGCFTRRFLTDDGREIEVDGSYRFESVSNIELIEYKAWLYSDRENASAPFVTLTESEDFRLYEEIMADESTWEYDYD